MSEFARALAAATAGAPAPRRWLFVPYDQLSADIGPLSQANPADLGLVFVETLWKGRRRPYHKQKLALVLTNLRHFALEQAARGFAVRYVYSRAPYEDVLAGLVPELGRIECMEPAERELRVALAQLVERGDIGVVPHAGWLSTVDDFRATQPAGGPYRMDRFYRHMRQQTGWLMRDGKPEAAVQL